MTLGHRVAVLKDGRLQQCDAPRVLYDAAGEHVRRRLHRLAGDEPLHGAGSTNGSVSLGGVDIALPECRRGGRRGGAERRPRRCGPRRSSSPPDGLAAEVEVVEELGADAYVFCVAEVAGGDDEARRARRRAAGAGARRARLAAAESRPRRTCSTRRPAS